MKISSHLDGFSKTAACGMSNKNVDSFQDFSSGVFNRINIKKKLYIIDTNLRQEKININKQGEKISDSFWLHFPVQQIFQLFPVITNRHMEVFFPRSGIFFQDQTFSCKIFQDSDISCKIPARIMHCLACIFLEVKSDRFLQKKPGSSTGQCSHLVDVCQCRCAHCLGCVKETHWLSLASSQTFGGTLAVTGNNKKLITQWETVQ